MITIFAWKTNKGLKRVHNIALTTVQLEACYNEFDDPTLLSSSNNRHCSFVLSVKKGDLFMIIASRIKHILFIEGELRNIKRNEFALKLTKKLSDVFSHAVQTQTNYWFMVRIG